MTVLNQKTITWSGFQRANSKVHVWHASLEQPAEVVQKLESLLSEEERQRADSFRAREHRRSFMISRGILRNLLHRYTGIEPDQIQFNYTIHGKPFLAGPESTPDISFNLSHAGLLVLYAFSWSRQVGIDVECIRPLEEMEKVAVMNFSSREYRNFQATGEKEMLTAFYNAWTRKEAFIKAVGTGIAFPLREVEVSLEPDVPARLVTIHGSLQEADRWTLHDIKTWDGYAAALVVEGKDHSISHRQWKYTRFL
jgi:4'-phosphopantetheinyl transferase